MTQEKEQKTILSISGMTCAICAQTIETQLLKIKGVTKAIVNLAAEKAIIDYDQNIVDQKTIEETIFKIGYKVIHEKVSIQITDMSCITCAQTIERILNEKEGVYKASVNFATEKATVEYNSEEISLAGIKKLIQDNHFINKRFNAILLLFNKFKKLSLDKNSYSISLEVVTGSILNNFSSL